MKIIIHKGAKEIGGTCIELSTNNNTILLDAGYPLAEESVPVDINKIKKDAILISHPHQDHFGLIEKAGDNTEIWIGRTAVDLINASRIFMGKNPLDFSSKFIEKWKPFNVGDFKITPYLVDHSVVDAYAFLIEAEGKRLFYSGDFRGHGRKKILFDKFIANPPEDIDVLFMEGTMMERTNERFPNEDAVEEMIYSTIKDQKNISFIVMSSQNIDRIAAVFRACKRAGKVFVIDAYTGYVLEKMKNITNKMPDILSDEIRVVLLKSHYDRMKNNKVFGNYINMVFKKRIKTPELKQYPTKYLMLLKPTMAKYMYKFRYISKPNLIYSQWEGYIKYDNTYNLNSMSKMYTTTKN